MPRLVAPHYAHIYQRPREGSAWVASYQAFEYKHRIMALGGDDTASFSLRVKPAEAEYIYSYLIGSVVRIHVDDPIQPIWEGYIERVTYRAGGLTMTRSLENMINRASVTFYNASAPGAVKTETTSVVDNTASQAIYGVKEATVDAGIHYDNADKTHKTVLRSTLAAIRAWPQVSVANGAGGGGALIEIELRGLQYMAWDWAVYASTAGTVAAWQVLERMTIRTDLSAPPNATYIYETAGAAGSVAARNIGQNTAFNMSRTSQSGQTYLQFIQSIVEAGDATNLWVYGITMLDPNALTRTVYYKAATTAVRYQAFAYKDTGRLRDTSGVLVPGWLVTPDCGVQLMDVLIGYNQVGDDPRIGYIMAIDYDAETGLVSFQTGDNVTIEGVLQKDRYFKAHGHWSRFGANVRNVL